MSQQPEQGFEPADSPPDVDGDARALREHPQSRLILYFVREFILRATGNVSRAFDNDFEAAILFLTISNRSAEKVMTDPRLREQYASYGTPIPHEHTEFVSRMALSRATGLPRETVRRKIGKLIQKGWVEEHKQGLCVRPDINGDPLYQAAIDAHPENLRRLFAMLQASGVLGGAAISPP